MKRYAFSGALVCALLLSGCGKIDHTAGPASATQPATAQRTGGDAGSPASWQT